MDGVVNLWTRARDAVLGLVRPQARAPLVIVHDPAAEGPQNLDDPFLDRQSQERIGKIIGARAKPKGDGAP